MTDSQINKTGVRDKNLWLLAQARVEMSRADQQLRSKVINWNTVVAHLQRAQDLLKQVVI